MGKTSLPPGFRFHPTDVELVMYYLKRKIMGRKFHSDAITEVDIYKCTPWDLPAKSSLRTGDLMWYFLSPRERKYGSGARINRATEFGFWKITGKDRPVNYNNKTVGMIKTLVFHRGKAPKGDRTDWVMHEYRIEDKDLENQGVIQTWKDGQVFQFSEGSSSSTAAPPARFPETASSCSLNVPEFTPTITQHNNLSIFHPPPSKGKEINCTMLTFSFASKLIVLG